MSVGDRNYVNILRYFVENKESIGDIELSFILRAWYNKIYAKCATVCSKEEIRKIKKNLLNELKNRINLIDNSQVPVFNADLACMQQDELKQKESYRRLLDYVENLNDDEIIELILCSLGLDPKDLKIQENRLRALELERLNGLSYKGKPCVVDDGVDKEIAQKIYGQIINDDLMSISDRVFKTLMANNSFRKLRYARDNSCNIIYSVVYGIYEEKIAKIKGEILENLKGVSRALFRRYSNDFEIDSLISELGNIGFLKKMFHGDDIQGLVSEVEALRDLINDSKKYKVEDSLIYPNDMMVYEKTEVSKFFVSKKDSILGQTGVIFDIKPEDIEAKINELRSEINDIVFKQNADICEMATHAEMYRIKNFASKLGIEIEKALDLLNNKNHIYMLLYNYVMGTMISDRVDSYGVKYAGDVLALLDKADELKAATHNCLPEPVKKIGVPNTSGNGQRVIEYHRKALK